LSKVVIAHEAREGMRITAAMCEAELNDGAPGTGPRRVHADV